MAEVGQGSIDGRRGGGGGADDFMDIVFSWSLQDVYDETLYKNQVEKIPERFDSVEQYLGSFIYPFLEETRAEVCSSLDAIATSPYAEVTGFEESKPHGTNLYNIKVDQWRNRLTEPGKEPYQTRPGDLLILADAKPETVSDLQRIGRFWAFAFVTGISYNDDGDDMDTNIKGGEELNAVNFKITIGEEMEEMVHKQLYVIFMVNLTTNKKTWKSLHMHGNWDILKEVLCTDSVGEEGCNLCLMQGNEDVVAGSLLSYLNESQKETALSCLYKTQCQHRHIIKLIRGPPGTGKTKTVSTMLFTLLNMKCKTLVCAPSNVAVKEVASRVQRLVRDSSLVSYGDILLFGRKDRLKMDSYTEEIYLEYRVDRIRECLAPLTGWRNCIASMITLLEDSVQQYNIFVENESVGNSNNEEEKSHNVGQRKPFIEFIRERYSSTLGPLDRCISILCIHISRSYMSKDIFDNMMGLPGHLKSFGKLLFQKDSNLFSSRLEEAFSRKATDRLSTKTPRDPLLTLYLKRCECLSALAVVQDSLNRLKLPSFMSKDLIREFCFQSATLFFCTASNTYKLHFVDMEPPKLLVIDEAAQLKECESVVPLQLAGLSHAVLVGDERQLPSIVKSKVSDEASFGRSLFERLSSLGKSKHLLDIQYRMHPSISHFPNRMFYGGQIQDAAIVKAQSYIRRYLPGSMFSPYAFINISDGREEHDDKGTSLRNLVEVAVALKLLKYLQQAWSSSSKQKLRIGIISPYAAQVGAIRARLGKKYEDSENSGGFVVNVKTVDGFQGGEEDIIIISTVRSNPQGNIGFLANCNNTNVALTRARHCLWILGNERTLRRSSLKTKQSVWEALVNDAIERQCFFNAEDDEGLAKTILEVKKEYDQLDDLLSGSSVLFRSARWKVIFSENFRQSFRKLISRQMKLSVINLLLKLSNGWRPKRRDMNMICENSLQIVKQFKVESLYVLCTVDIEKDFNYVQVLKVWDVLPSEDIPKTVKRLDGIYETYSNDYIDRCKEKSLDGLLEVPKSWQAPFNFRRSGNSSTENQEGHDLDSVLDSCSYAENSKVNDSLLLMKFYPLSSDIVNHLLSDKDGKEVELPFEVTNEEREIINFPRSTFILGRSGTGKTTILTMKLFKKEQLYQMALNRDGNGGFSDRTNNEERDEDPNTDGLHQLFVTVSPKLCFAVRRHISQLKSFACGRNILPESPSGDIDFIDSTDQFKDIPDSFFDIPPKSYPLVVTFQKFLIMLDGTIGVSYFERFPDLRKICRGKVGPIRSLALQTYVRAKEVNYEKFCTTYWPHFNEALMRKFDPSRVFTEIISHIKGGIRVVDSSNGRISREDYVLLSEGRASTLTVDEREKMYDIFLDYEKMKARNGEFDLSDLVNDLHSRLQHEKWKGDRMEFVYIDEVQDLTMRQIALFKNISSNVEEGFVFSGDTAQTIARGIDFRFEDIRFLFYKEFSHGLGDEVQQNLHKGRISKVFHLSQNFRTHAAILKLAQSVINLLSHYFPLLIDILSPEVSRICGEAPIFLESGNEENAIISIFGNNLSVGVNVVGFGAEQVILVRDDCARHEVLNYVGKQALILTVVECKGLEFQDVLLYNFFGSSPMKNQWRVIYEYMKEQNLLDNSFPRGFPNFDLAKHNILCSELKQLYVAITRTRQRLWIVESNMEFSKPMFDYWKKLCLIQVRKLDNYLAEEMKVASTPEQWKSQGWKLMDENNYEMATMCFERAQFALGEKFARAAGLNAAADQMSISNPEEASHFRRQAGEMYESIGKNERAAQCFLALKDYERAGTLFESIGMAEFAAECFYELKEYERAGSIYLEKCGESSLERAGECFLLAGCCSQAADVYSKGNFLSQCLSACAQGNLFELGLSYIQSWKEGAKTSKPDTVKIEQDFLETCAHHYYKQKNFKMMMRFVKVFPSMEAMRSFLRSLNCLEELLSMEEEFGNFLKAADVAKLKGDTLLEARLLGKGGHFKEASMCILWYVLYSSLWGTPGSRGWPLKKFEGKKDLLRRAKSYAILVSEHFYHYAQIESTVLLDEVISLPELGELLSGSSRNKNITGEILCSWKILDVHLKSDVSLFCCEDNLVPDFKDFSEKQILRNQVSVEAMFYFWSLWRDEIICIIDNVQCLEKQEANEYTSYVEFCLNYMGVLKLYNSKAEPIYLLLNPEAEWARNIGDGSFRRNGKLVPLELRHFVVAAKKYWGSELVSVTIKVLHCLDALYKLRSSVSVGISKPEYSQCRVLIHIYEVAEFLLTSKSLICHHSDKQVIWNFIRDSTLRYLSCVFPLDWRSSLRANIVSLRGSKASSRLLRQAFELVNPKKKLTYGQIGQLTMIILGSGKLDSPSYLKVLECFQEDTPWKILFDCLHQEKGRGSSRNVFSEVSAVQKFHEALAETFNANWRKEVDYISPSCFLYLLERLLILSSSFRPHMFTTESGFVEWLMFHEGDTMVRPNSVPYPVEPFELILEFIPYAIQLLLRNRSDTVEWIGKSGVTEREQYHRLLVLKLFMLLSLLHINFSVCGDLLCKLLTTWYISDYLPREFFNPLWRAFKHGNELEITVPAIAEAFRRVNDPLVIISWERDFSNPVPRDALCVEITKYRTSEDVLRFLFPDIAKARKHQGDALKDGAENSSSNVRPSSSNDLGENSEMGVSSDIVEETSSIGESPSENIKTVMELWKVVDMLESVGKVEDQPGIVSSAKALKVDFDKCLSEFYQALNEHIWEAKGNFSGEEALPDTFRQNLSGMLDDLRQLHAALSFSDRKLEDKISAIVEISRRLQLRRPMLEHFLCHMFQERSNGAEVNPEDSRASTATRKGIENKNQGNNKSKAKKKSKRGRK
ncbi:uncharacterized protein LOC116209063 isoform X2 [Punica granatum]|uniref:Uncharacterized protein LOC116209063 isoform X2 n=1 Tax=Punica granatum TaxID=22663 RepID=A0A6P8E136_PUNGR|nr:uncharacterized protein LOC116209063 isoform X2 [Punica granatum]